MNTQNPKPEPERFEVYMPVPNAPATELAICQAQVDEVMARTGRFIDERNACFIGGAFRKEIESVLLG